MSKYFDIETNPLPVSELEAGMPEFEAPKNIKDPAKIAAKLAEKREAYIEKAALSPLTGQVMSAGIYDADLDSYGSIVADGRSEGDVLQWIWDNLNISNEFNTDIFGWNLNGFDMPFTIKRSWACGVKMPSSVLEFYRGRSYLNQQFKDLMQYFCIGSDERYMRLNSALDLLGLDRKVELEGLFYEVYPENPALAMEYLERDVRSLYAIAKRVL